VRVFLVAYIATNSIGEAIKRFKAFSRIWIFLIMSRVTLQIFTFLLVRKVDEQILQKREGHVRATEKEN
jgi:hypothetical protein